jgi:hypothetical protein
MKEYIGQNVLVTTQDWFYGTDGKSYRGAWGKFKAVHEAKDALGILPNRPNVNWFLEIGNMSIMGCQVMHVIKCPEPPPEYSIKDHSRDSPNGIIEYQRPSEIFIMNEQNN